jgi:transcriptional antiterminator RfaH
MRASERQQVDSAPAPAPGPHWYACYTRSRHEKQVDRLLREQGFESFLPLVRQTRRWADRQKQVSTVLFPSYVFARSSMEQLYGVLAIPGVTSLVRRNGQPVVVPDEEVVNVRRVAESLSIHGRKPRFAPLPQVGTRVRIVEGPFEGVVGTVSDHRNHGHVLVGLTAIGVGIHVEVDAAVVKPIEC